MSQILRGTWEETGGSSAATSFTSTADIEPCAEGITVYQVVLTGPGIECTGFAHAASDADHLEALRRIDPDTIPVDLDRVECVDVRAIGV